MGSTFYHLPHQLLASGFERLMKCYIAVVRKGRDGAYPDRAAMKKLGHDLESLLETICTQHYCGTQRPLVQQDLAFIRTDPVLNDCVRIPSLFRKAGRNYNARGPWLFPLLCLASRQWIQDGQTAGQRSPRIQQLLLGLPARPPGLPPTI